MRNASILLLCLAALGCGGKGKSGDSSSGSDGGGPTQIMPDAGVGGTGGTETDSGTSEGGSAGEDSGTDTGGTETDAGGGTDAGGSAGEAGSAGTSGEPPALEELRVAMNLTDAGYQVLDDQDQEVWQEQAADCGLIQPNGYVICYVDMEPGDYTIVPEDVPSYVTPEEVAIHLNPVTSTVYLAYTAEPEEGTDGG